VGKLYTRRKDGLTNLECPPVWLNGHQVMRSLDVHGCGLRACPRRALRGGKGRESDDLAETAVADGNETVAETATADAGRPPAPYFAPRYPFPPEPCTAEPCAVEPSAADARRLGRTG